ncbi:MAG: CBS domain-containing protein [Thermoproteota archaeon]|nr:CBS domain-containing protein [Thermoproteota archaeon]
MSEPGSSITEIAKVMVDLNVSSVAIIREEKEEGEYDDTERQRRNKKEVIGILTERDIVKSVARGVSSDRVTAGSIISSSPILSIAKDRSVEEAALLMMRNKVRHLLVEDPATNEVVGIITTTDLARYLRKRMKQITQVATGDDYEASEPQERQEQSSRTSSEMLLSEVWELYF